MSIAEQRLRNACSRLLQAACQSGESGAIRDYFESYRDSEAQRRQRFAELSDQLLRGPNRVETEAFHLLRELNADYRTRFDIRHLETAGRVILTSVDQPLRSQELFALSDDEAGQVADQLPDIISGIAEKSGKRPYSLITKYLHFLFPALHVIYDSQAAQSAWMWSLFAFEDENPAIESFTYASLSDRSGKSYHSLVRLYKLLWQNSERQDRKRALQTAESLQQFLRDVPDCGNARVTVLDLIDKHLWSCNGNPITLGLAAA